MKEFEKFKMGYVVYPNGTVAPVCYCEDSQYPEEVTVFNGVYYEEFNRDEVYDTKPGPDVIKAVRIAALKEDFNDLRERTEAYEDDFKEAALNMEHITAMKNTCRKEMEKIAEKICKLEKEIENDGR